MGRSRTKIGESRATRAQSRRAGPSGALGGVTKKNRGRFPAGKDTAGRHEAPFRGRWLRLRQLKANSYPFESEFATGKVSGRSAAQGSRLVSLVEGPELPCEAQGAGSKSWLSILVFVLAAD